MIDPRSYAQLNEAVVKLKPDKDSDLNGISRIHDLCDTSAVLYQLSYHAMQRAAGHLVSS